MVLSLSENRGVDFWPIFRKATNFRSKTIPKNQLQNKISNWIFLFFFQETWQRKFTSKMSCVLNFRETFRNCVIKIMLFTIDRQLNICRFIITRNFFGIPSHQKAHQKLIRGYQNLAILNWFSKDFRKLFEIIFKGTKSWIICNLRSFQVFFRL